MSGITCMLAEKWEPEIDPTGWWMSEKLDGVRAVWNGSSFYSRNGGKFYAPKWFTASFPKTTLDGELWGGRKVFQRTVGIVKTKTPVDEDWKYISYMVFDAPKHQGKFEERIKHCKDILKGVKTAQVVGMSLCTGTNHLLTILGDLEATGGEGIMLRKPKSAYEGKRSTSLLKVKTFRDEEALIVGHKKGSGRNSGRMGALLVKTPDGRDFKVGTGFTDEMRDKPPKIGTVITYRFQELSNNGHPRFPSYVGERIDLKWEDICKTYVPPTLNTRTIKRTHTILFGSINNNNNNNDDDEEKNDEKNDEKEDGNGEEDDEEEDDEEDVVAKTQKKLAKSSSFISAISKGPNKIINNTANKSTGKNDQDNPLCVFGSKCYRKNPQHLSQFYHPPSSKLSGKKRNLESDEENEDDNEDEENKNDNKNDNKKRKLNEEEEEEINEDEEDNNIDDDDDDEEFNPKKMSREYLKKKVADANKKKKAEPKGRPPSAPNVPCPLGANCQNNFIDHRSRFIHPIADDKNTSKNDSKNDSKNSGKNDENKVKNGNSNTNLSKNNNSNEENKKITNNNNNNLNNNTNKNDNNNKLRSPSPPGNKEEEREAEEDLRVVLKVFLVEVDKDGIPTRSLSLSSNQNQDPTPELDLDSDEENAQSDHEDNREEEEKKVQLNEIELPLSGDLILGRSSHLNCKSLDDLKLSRKQLRLVVRINPILPYSIDVNDVICVEIEHVGLNFGFYRSANEVSFKKKITKGNLYRLFHNDQFALLPDLSVCFRVEFRHCVVAVKKD